MKRRAVLAFLIVLGGCGGLQSVGSAEDAAPIALAEQSSEQRGAAYAEGNCASCHAVGRSGSSPLVAAPAFRSLGLRYPVADLAEAFAEGIMTSHSSMPEFVLSRRDNADLIAYLESIQTQPDR